MPVIMTSETCEKLFPGLAKKEIIIPAWNDIIHLVRPPSYTDTETALMNDIAARVYVVGWSEGRTAEYLGITSLEVRDWLSKYNELEDLYKTKQQTAIDLSKSPTPEILKNLGVIMTALDDIQDFATTVGVLSRVIGRVFKPAELLAIGSFTVGEFLNRLNLLQKLTGSEKAIVCKMVKELKKSSHWGSIKADVDARMKRLFPTKGEALEILQTTDSLFGVGISLGPIVGLVQDAIFGAFIGAPVRFKAWTISEREKAVIFNVFNRLIHPEIGFEYAFKDIARWAESAANVIVGGESLNWNDFATGLVTSISTGVQMRCTKVKEAAISIWETISGQAATPPKKTSVETKFLLQRLGIDPARQDAWPVPGLGPTATIQEIMDAYSAQSMKVLEYWRNKLGVSDEGLFLDACVKEIGLHASAMFCAEDGVINESLDPTALIYIHALESGLNPPPETSAEKFTAWHDYILERMQYLSINSPTLPILQEAHTKFFGG